MHWKSKSAATAPAATREVRARAQALAPASTTAKGYSASSCLTPICNRDVMQLRRIATNASPMPIAGTYVSLPYRFNSHGDTSNKISRHSELLISSAAGKYNHVPVG